MATNTPKVGNKNDSGIARGSTKADVSGQVLPVTNPLDLWYLCEKARYAKANPYRRSGDEAPMYQRTVALLVRTDNEMFEYRWPYCAEVGYDMTKEPPAPIMSKKQPHRPSSFPLSQYKRISSTHLPEYSSVEVVTDILGSKELEQMIEIPLPAEVENGIRLGTGKKKRVLLRIPDVVRVIDHTSGGEGQYSQSNLASVIEMKFERDVLDEQQRMAYVEIAGSTERFRLLRTDRCDKADRRQRREWMTAAQHEPVYKPVSQVLSRPLRASADPHGLIVGLIDAEHLAARRHLEVQLPLPGTHLMSASPDMREANAQAARARRQMEMPLVAPFLAWAAPIFTSGATATAGTGTLKTAVLTARAGPQVVRYARLLDWARLGIGTSVASAPLAFAKTEDGSSSPVLTPEQLRHWQAYRDWEATQLHKPRTEQLYLFWPDAPEIDQ